MKKLILDVDTGVDDAQGIMVVLATPGVEVLGITCCSGNTPVKNACKNTLRVLQACGRLDIPVFRGAVEPLLGRALHAADFHGKDGLGDAPDPNAPEMHLVQKERAPQAMIRMVNQHPGEVTLVAVAPLTNLALAVKLDPHFPEKLKGLYIMGGNKDSRGNTTVCGEFNFAADPEAAYIVLNRFLCPTYIATWEFCCLYKLPWSFCDKWLAQDTSKARFMKQIFQHTMTMAQSDRYQKEMVGGGGFTSCDTLAMLAAVDDAFVQGSEEVAVTVELDGTHTRGMMVLDYMELLKKKHKAFVMTKADMEKIKKKLMESLA